MKKYFCVETDEQVVFGETIRLTFFKENKDCKVTVEKQIEFNEHTLNWMMGMGFVEEREVEEEEDNNDLLNFDVPCEELSDLIEDFEALEQRFDSLEGRIANIEKVLCNRETAQPKKKQ